MIPEKFTCNIAVDKQGAYSVDFKGTLLYYPVLGEVEKQGKVSEATDQQIKERFDEAVAKEPAIKKYEYRNSGRGYIEYFNKVTDNSTLDLSKLFSLPVVISVQADDIITITARSLTDKNKEQLVGFTKLGYKLDGVIQITSDLPIIDASGQKV